MKSTLVLLLLVCFSESSSSLNPAATSQPEKQSSWPNKPLHSNLMIENPSLFSPRMDYDEWTPLGRGDPLKNDPTYDYVPPVLERVHYWMDPSKRTPDPPLPNSGVLVLGSRTESTFTTRPTTPRYQTFQSKESQADSRIDTSSLLDPFFKLMDVSQFNLNFNSNANYKPSLNRIQRPHYQPNKQRTQPPQALQRPPYTMLMPPPPPPPPVPQSTNFITTVSDKTQTTAPIPPTSNPPPTAKNATTINPTVLANTENVFKPVAISMPEHVDPFENETHNEITVKSKKETTEATTYVSEHQTHTKPFKNTEKHGPHATTTPYIKLNHKEHVKIQPRPHESEAPNHVPKKPTKMPPWYRETENRATITPPVTTTKINTLTTDPMFKHYKQPSEPIKGPFYLIIQGHSKVKTYGASKNPVNKLLTSNEIKYDDEEMKKTKFERKTRRLRYESLSQEGENKLEDGDNEMRSFKLPDNLESLEETFGKSNGGSSKKRYLGSNHRRKRFAYDSIIKPKRRLLSETTEADCEPKEGKNATLSSDNLDLESLIAISDDYDPEDVASILLKDEGSQGSGFGGLALSIVSRSETAGEEM